LYWSSCEWAQPSNLFLEISRATILESLFESTFYSFNVFIYWIEDKLYCIFVNVHCIYVLIIYIYIHFVLLIKSGSLPLVYFPFESQGYLFRIKIFGVSIEDKLLQNVWLDSGDRKIGENTKCMELQRHFMKVNHIIDLST